jgi:hypothetical protein
MKIKKYDMFGNPINDAQVSDELDPFLENFRVSDTPSRKPDIVAPITKKLDVVVPVEKVKEVVLDTPKITREERQALREEAYNLKKAARQKKYELVNAAQRASEEAFQQRKKEVAERALKKAASSVDVKDIVGTLLKKIPKSKLALAALTGGASLAAQAAEEGFDANSANEEESDQIRQMVEEEKASKYRKNRPEMRNILNKADESLRTFGPSDYDLKQMSDKPEFRGLRNKLK